MTRAKNLYLALLATFLSPMAANAVPITWEIKGVIDTADDTSSSEIGDAFTVLISFDTDASLETAQTGGRFDPGTRYQYVASAVSFLVSLEGQSDQSVTPFGDGIDLLWLRDNSGDRSCCEFEEVDGLTFALQDLNGFGASIIFRGSILDIFSGGQLPTNPDPRLVDLEIARFQWLAENGSAFGQVESIRRVAEPGTLALLGLGLLGMGAVRRRKV
jgi:hypothetical protein